MGQRRGAGAKRRSRSQRGQQRRGKKEATYARQQHRGRENVREASEVAIE